MTPQEALAAALFNDESNISNLGNPFLSKDACLVIATRVLAALSGWTLVKDEELERLRRIETAAQTLDAEIERSRPLDAAPGPALYRIHPSHDALRAALTQEAPNAK